jgi:hypothetical protein
MTKAIRTIVLAGLVSAGGVWAAPAFGEMTDGKPMGMLAGADGHHAVGKVVLSKGRSGNPALFLLDAKIDRVPDGRVHLAKGGDYTMGVELGKLTEFSGALEFPIPAGVNAQDYDSVVIWCHKFNVKIGVAFFQMGAVK